MDHNIRQVNLFNMTLIKDFTVEKQLQVVHTILLIIFKQTGDRNRKQGQKWLRLNSASCKAIRGINSALNWPPI